MYVFGVYAFYVFIYGPPVIDVCETENLKLIAILLKVCVLTSLDRPSHLFTYVITLYVT